MAIKLEFRLISNPINDNSFVIGFKSLFNNYPSSTQGFTFKTIATNQFIQIGNNVLDTSINLFNTLLNFYLNQNNWIKIYQKTNGVDILLDSDDALITLNPPIVNGNFTITIVNVLPIIFTRDKIILSRSPFNFIINLDFLFDSAILNLKIYRGNKNTDIPILTTFSLSKNVIIAGQEKINFEISKFLNDFCKSNIIDFNNLGVNTSTSLDSVWIETEVKMFYQNLLLTEEKNIFYSIDGYDYHTSLFNPKLKNNVLTSNDNHIFLKGSDYPLYFVTKDLVSIRINNVLIQFTLDDNLNNQLIAFVNIGLYAENNSILTAVFTYNNSIVETHNFKVIDSCRFENYNVFFKNRFGFWQSIPFQLKNKKEIEIETSNYFPVVSNFGEYSLLSHNQKTTLSNVKEKITINTDFIPEYYNEIIEEMMYSEFIYIENKKKYLPINLNKKSFEKKTRMFDKKIQYSFDFTYSFNKINNVK